MGSYWAKILIQCTVWKGQRRHQRIKILTPYTNDTVDTHVFSRIDIPYRYFCRTYGKMLSLTSYIFPQITAGH